MVECTRSLFLHLFRCSGGIGFLWSIVWLAIIHNSPKTHPRISQQEKTYLIRSIGLDQPKQKVRNESCNESGTLSFHQCSVVECCVSCLFIARCMFSLPTTKTGSFVSYLLGKNVKLTNLLTFQPTLKILKPTPAFYFFHCTSLSEILQIRDAQTFHYCRPWCYFYFYELRPPVSSRYFLHCFCSASPNSNQRSFTRLFGRRSNTYRHTVEEKLLLMHGRHILHF